MAVSISRNEQPPIQPLARPQSHCRKSVSVRTAQHFLHVRNCYSIITFWTIYFRSNGYYLDQRIFLTVAAIFAVALIVMQTRRSELVSRYDFIWKLQVAAIAPKICKFNILGSGRTARNEATPRSESQRLREYPALARRQAFPRRTKSKSERRLP